MVTSTQTINWCLQYSNSCIDNWPILLVQDIDSECPVSQDHPLSLKWKYEVQFFPKGVSQLLPHPRQSATVHQGPTLFFFYSLIPAGGEFGMWIVVFVLKKACWIYLGKWGLYRKKQWLTSDNPSMGAKVVGQEDECFRGTDYGMLDIGKDN